MRVRLGGTSAVYICNGLAVKVLKEDGVIRWGPFEGEPFDKELTFQKELANLQRAAGVPFVPKLVDHDADNFVIVTTDVGESLGALRESKGLQLRWVEHRDWVTKGIADLEARGIFVVDVTGDNFCFDGRRVRLVDLTHSASKKSYSRPDLLERAKKWFI